MLIVVEGRVKGAGIWNKLFGRGLHPPSSGSPGVSPKDNGMKILVFMQHLLTSATIIT